MKKTFSFTLAFVMLAAVCMPQTLALGSSCRTVALSDFAASSTELTTDKKHELLFTANILTTGGKADAAVYDDRGNIITHLNDSGKDGDKIKNDGIYSARIIPDITENRTVTYTLRSDGLESNPFDVNYYHQLTEKELQEHENFWNAAEEYEENLRLNGVEAKDVLQAMYSYISTDPAIDRSSIQWEKDYTFVFTFKSGAKGFYEEFELMPHAEDTRSTMQVFPTEVTRTIEEASWTDPDVLVFRPYRNTPSAGSFDNEFYTNIASGICEITGGQYVDCKEQSAYPGNLKNMDQYGFFFIDSHGTTAYGKSYMIMRKGDTSNYDYSADLSAGHIMTSGSDIGVTGSFFTKYIQNQGKTLPDTLVYLVICLGMKTTAICNPMLSCGAELVAGYTESVSFSYDFSFSAVLWEKLFESHPTYPERTYTFSEAVTAAKQRVGNYDYSSGATMVTAGNANFVMHVENYDPVESVILSDTDISLYQNNTHALGFEVTGGNIRYTSSWSSSDPAVASVSESGVVTSRNEGVATVTLTVTDLSDDENPRQITAECTVHSLGALHVTGLEILTSSLELYESTSGEYIEVRVLPENATDKRLTYKSNDENIVTVTADGLAVPVAMGTATVTVTTVDGGFSGEVTCVVRENGFNEAINVQGSRLELITTGDYPFEATIHDEKACVVSTNKGVNSSKSEIVLDAGHLNAGSKISFDQKVSSEVNCDILLFCVNGNEVNRLSGYKNWEHYEYTVPASGEYVFSWQYLKDTSDSAYDDRAWIDAVELYREGELHTVTFYDMDETTVIAEIEAAHGASVTPPEAPVHEGYNFTGWSYATTIVRSDLSIYALYEKVNTPTPPESDVPTPPESETPTPPDSDDTAEYPLGDTNMDRAVNTADAVAILKYAAGMAQLSDAQLLLSEVNHDNAVNTADAVAILKYAAGMIQAF
ncbi:MAG: Ig-like domain-containing protein [Clostridia bacterium]|nr:Ig-like domain-containing protein [Clostridia bacterium]